jgi:hypothetical protein
MYCLPIMVLITQKNYLMTRCVMIYDSYDMIYYVSITALDFENHALTLYPTNSIFMLHCIFIHFDAQSLTSLPFYFTFYSLYCLRCKTISRRAVRRLIVLHSKQNIESELKWRTCFCAMPISNRLVVRGWVDHLCANIMVTCTHSHCLDRCNNV